ncbi:MAG: class I SAM-dependent methyltransferase, partial [Prevotellaceae bacterium]|nr:class I SAM-dependent methyltransferase [Prevotellaceae bacterium]
MKVKSRISLLLRQFRIIRIFDKIFFSICYIKTYKKRKAFKKSNPNAILPPAYYIYETFGLDYNQFYTLNDEAAKWLISFFEKYKSLHEINILDWGCGPGRIIRQMPSLLDKTCQCYGTDYNSKYIEWCSKNIPEVTFKL